MKITKDLIKEKYEEYNKLYFGGKLGKCVFGLLPKTQPYLGRFVHREDLKGKAYGEIKIGTCIRWTEEMFKGTLIHEMVHMYNYFVDGPICYSIFLNGLFHHGFFFKRQCWRLKRKYGLDIPIHIKWFQDYDYIIKNIGPSKIDRFFSRLFGA